METDEPDPKMSQLEAAAHNARWRSAEEEAGRMLSGGLAAAQGGPRTSRSREEILRDLEALKAKHGQR